MKYDLSNKKQLQDAKDRLNHLYTKGATVDIIEKSIKRTLSQNRYLHLILSDFALNFGLTLEEAKQDIFKKLVNNDLFYEGEINDFNGGTFSRYRSTSDLTKGEKITAINRFIKFSCENGHNLPDAKNLLHIYEIENNIESIENAKYL